MVTDRKRDAEIRARIERAKCELARQDALLREAIRASGGKPPPGLEACLRYEQAVPQRAAVWAGALRA